MLRRLSSSLFAVCVVVAGVSGCATTPSVNIVGLEAAPALAPRGADRLVLVDGEGRKSGREDVALVFRDIARGGFYGVDDRADEGVKLTLVGDTGKLDGDTRAPRASELFVRIDVLVWEATPAIIRSETPEGAIVEEPGLHGRADLQISVINAAGTVLMREREYLGASDFVDDGRLHPRMVIREAARAALAAFITDITPQRRSSTVTFDAGDTGQERILERARTEPLGAIEKSLRRYLKKNEGNAIAMYNLAVALDGQGKFEEALAMYDKAIEVVNRAGFAQARADCSARLQAWERVYGPRKQPKNVDDDADPKAAPKAESKAEAKEPTGPAAPPAP